MGIFRSFSMNDKMAKNITNSSNTGPSIKSIFKKLNEFINGTNKDKDIVDLLKGISSTLLVKLDYSKLPEGFINKIANNLAGGLSEIPQ